MKVSNENHMWFEFYDSHQQPEKKNMGVSIDIFPQAQQVKDLTGKIVFWLIPRPIQNLRPLELPSCFLFLDFYTLMFTFHWNTVTAFL